MKTTEPYNMPSYSACAREDELDEFRARVPLGSLAPEFVLPDLDGSSVALCELRGRYVVLDFGSIT